MQIKCDFFSIDSIWINREFSRSMNQAKQSSVRVWMKQAEMSHTSHCLNLKVSCVERSPLWLIVYRTHAINDTFNSENPLTKSTNASITRYDTRQCDTIRYGQQHLFDFSCNKPEKMPISTLFPFIFMKKIHPKLSIQQRKKLKLYIRSAVCCVLCALCIDRGREYCECQK